MAAYTYRQGEEEPADLQAARRGLAKEGKAVKEGTWKEDGADVAENDGDIYLSSVRASQQSASVSALPECSDDASVKWDQGASRASGSPTASALGGKGSLGLSVSEQDDDSKPATDNIDKVVRVASGVGVGEVTAEVDLTELD